MIHQEYVTQPAGGINYLTLFDAALRRRPFDALDAAVAYATMGGVVELSRQCRRSAGGDWDSMEKRWLVGIDYCRTEPLAIEMLSSQANSSVRVHDGRVVVGRRRCTPLVPFHPKAYVFRSESATAIVSGSGNLSRNGLTRGHEVGSLLVVRDPRSPEERAASQMCVAVRDWFDDLWRRASSAARLLPTYRSVFDDAEHMRAPVPTDDDAGATQRLDTAARTRGLSAEHLRQLRTARHLWIEAGTLTRNRGVGLPGNQLMLSRMTRVFFGFPPADVPRDTFVGMVSMRYHRNRRNDCSLRFSNNSMDVLGLLIPGQGGPASYDGENLHFERLADGTFRLTLGTDADKRRWVGASRHVDGLHRMTSGRLWGVY